MNAPLRRVALATLLVFAVLFLNVNYLQVLRADELRRDPRNRRLLLEGYSRERGPIIAGDRTVASSAKTRGRLRYLRRYSLGNPHQAVAFAPVTGYFSLVYGTAGVERAYDPILSGDDSRLFVRRVSDLITGRQPEGGAVRLTIDPALQMSALGALGRNRGAVVVLDVRTGAVRAMVTNPSYDPNALSSHQPQSIREAFSRLERDPGQPLLNRATQQTYPPGSTFKIITAAAALERRVAQLDTPVPSPRELDLPLTDRKVGNFGDSSCGGAQVPLIRAMEISCNTAFAALGLRLGGDALRETAERFGFNSVPELDLPLARSHVPDDLDQPQSALSAIGQYEVRATPLQMALVAAAVANRGQAMTPYVVGEVQGPDLSVLDRTEPRPMPRAVSPQTAGALAAMMQAVVASGTGRRAAIPGVAVAGKTGTAQRGEGQPPHAWFIGYAPAQQPRFAIAVVVEAGGVVGGDATGGRTAAPIAGAVLRTALGVR